MEDQLLDPAATLYAEDSGAWASFVYDRPEAAGWFDDDGAPR
jgi:hypothetical protein